MDDLVRWLGQQLDKDEQAARGATPGPWYATAYDYPTDFAAGIGTSPGEMDVVGHGYEGGGVARLGDAHHIAAHDPSRVLRDIDAKRRILAEYEQAARYATTTWGQGNADQSRARTLGKVVHLLALAYADRSGYLEKWRP